MNHDALRKAMQLFVRENRTYRTSRSQQCLRDKTATVHGKMQCTYQYIYIWCLMNDFHYLLFIYF